MSVERDDRDDAQRGRVPGRHLELHGDFPACHLEELARRFECGVHAYAITTNVIVSYVEVPIDVSVSADKLKLGIPIGETMARCYTVIGFDSR